MTLLVLRTVQQDPLRGKRLMEILNMETEDRELVQEALNIINQTDAVEYSIKKCQEMKEKAEKSLEGLELNSEGVDSLIQLVHFALNREK